MDSISHAPLDIADVARRTGLTSRALRFYEARGLVQPLRSASGRRYYGPAELERLHQILLLKQAGLTLAQIQRLSGRSAIDLATLIATQLEQLDNQARQIAQARDLLLQVQSRIDRSEPIDVATFCSLIRNGEKAMTTDNWKKVTDRYMSAAEQAEFADAMCAIPADYDRAAYAAKWADLGARIEAAMPMEATSEKARAFLAEWRALLKPFTDVATPGMMASTARLYANMGEWEGEADPGFDKATFDFMGAVAAAERS